MVNLLDNSLWDVLTKDIIIRIYEYDRTKKEKFDTVINQLRNTCILCKRQYSQYIIKDGATNYVEETECGMIKCTHSFCNHCYTELANRQIDNCPICDFDITIITEVYYEYDNDLDTDSEYNFTDEDEESTEESSISLINEFSDNYDSEEGYDSDSDCYD